MKTKIARDFAQNDGVPKGALVNRVGGVEIKIEIEHIDASLAEKTKLAALCMPRHGRTHILLAHAALLRHARNLKLSGRRRNIGIDTRSGGGRQVCRNV